MASVTDIGRARAPQGPGSAAVARASLRPRAALASSDALVLSGVTRAFGALRAVDDVSLNVAAGQKYAIRVDYTERTGEAYLKLIWANPNRKQRIVPTSQLYTP